LSVLQISQLEKNIDDFTLGPINLTVEQETITAFVGNNGSGKSTLMKLMMNLVKQDEGEIYLFDEKIVPTNERWKRFVGYQPQTAVGYASFTGQALKNMIAPLYPTWDDKLFAAVVSELNIPLNKKFNKLSPGAQQKLSFALTIARNTPLLILDEPTAHLDIPSKKIMVDRLVAWMESGERSMIISSHQVEDIKKLADYLFVLHHGKMIGHFEKGELSEQYARFWLTKPLIDRNIPHIIAQDGLAIVSNNAEQTEAYLTEQQIEYISREQIDLEEIITFLLTKKI